MIRAAVSLTAALLAAGTPPAKESGVPAYVFSYDDYAAALAHVDTEGRVDYAGLKAQRAPLDSFVAALDAVSPEGYRSWPAPDQIAFWLNAYNALTLQLVVDHYPIAPPQPRNGFPVHSIGQIAGAWDQKRFRVMGEKLSLDEIEHRRLRAAFKEPRIHMALVCAAVSCPKLRNEPYQGATLDAQLEAQARAFLSNPRHFRIDRSRGEVKASRIFEWFARDFLPDASAATEPSALQRQAVAKFAARYVSDADRRYLEAGAFKVTFVEYDWTLNDRTR